MDTLMAAIEKVDDDYLAGLCNKGILKRAYKDLEQEEPVLSRAGQGTECGTEARVQLKEEQCLIRVPFGESSCSCPSRSMCRHIITAILWMKRQAGQETDGRNSGEADSAGEGAEAKAQPVSGRAMDQERSREQFAELLQVSAAQLRRACGGKHYREFLAHIRAGDHLLIRESSVVTVAIPWEKAEVRLLEPLAYSTCSCHSKELCTHKAQALLAYCLKKGRMRLEELEKLQETESSLDVSLIRESCEGIRENLDRQLCTGLSRASREASESLERMALIAHRSGLPELERMLRETAACYEQYFSRSAAFRSEELLEKLLLAHGRAGRILKARGQEEIRALAGSFRDEYEPAGRLHLLGMGGRTFSSKTGYEGEIYYFLETGEKEWYTWTDARPVFYENTGKKRPANPEGSQAPWGLNCSRERLKELEFDLLNARTASGGRLSASQESKGEITGIRSLELETLRELICWDYEGLLRKYFSPGADRRKRQGRQERLALVGAAGWGAASFDKVEQRFSWRIFDIRGQELFISLRYTRQERMTISLLERLERRLQGSFQGVLVFFGSLYMEEGRLCLYPVECFFQEREEADRILQQKKGSEVEPEDGPDQQITAAVIDTMEQYFREARRGLWDLLLGGLDSVPEEMLSELETLSGEGEALGLHFAGEKLGEICSLLKEKRHRMEFSPEPVIEAMGGLSDYFDSCGEKLSYDRALLAMREQGCCAFVQ